MASRRSRWIKSPVVFVRVGWMDFYGLRPEEEGPIGGGSFNREHRGAESTNFRIARSGRCYGYYRSARKGEGFNLERIVPSAEGKLVDGVLVVIFATEPGRGGQRIVGWYRNARCYGQARKRGNQIYLFEADAKDCVLVPSWLRHEGPLVPTGKAGAGQANVAYSLDAGGRPRGRDWIDAALQWLNGFQGPNLLRDDPGPSRRPATGRRLSPGRGGGGEGRAHKLLKEYVAQNPRAVGLPKRSKAAIEYPFVCGDQVDVKFDLPDGRAAVVEVETDYCWEGAHQCIKYRALLEAKRGDHINSGAVEAILVAHRFREETIAFTERYGIRTVAIPPRT